MTKTAVGEMPEDPFPEDAALDLLAPGDHRSELPNGWDVKFLRGDENAVTMICVLNSSCVADFVDHTFRFRDHACQESVDALLDWADDLGEALAYAVFRDESPLYEDPDD